MSKHGTLLTLGAVVVLMVVACGGGGTPTSVTATPTPTVAPVPVATVRFEVRTTCGGTSNGVPVASDPMPPPYVFPLRTSGWPHCLRVLQGGVPEGCSFSGSLTTNQSLGIFNDRDTWTLGPGKANYGPLISGELPRGENEQSLADFGLELNPGIYPFTAKLAWSCNDGRSGQAEDAFLTITQLNGQGQ